MTTDPILKPPRAREGWRGEILATLALAWPLALANTAQMMVHAIDVIFVARLGEDALAASSLGISLFIVVLGSLTGMTGFVAALIAAELGRRKHAVREVRRSVRMGLWLAVGLGAVTLLPLHFGNAIMLATGQDPHVADLAGRFLRILMWAGVPMLCSSVLRNFVSALGRPVFATMITVTAIGVGALANYSFVFGHFGMPALGIEGSALASVTVSCFICASYVVAIYSDRRLRRYRVFGNWWRPEWSRLRELLAKGSPVAFTILAEIGLFASAAFLMGRIGPAQLAAHALALQLASIAFQIPFGVGQAATIRVGYHFGAKDEDGIARAGWSALAIGAGVMLLSAGLMVLAPLPILRLYVDVDLPQNAEMIAFAVQFMMIAAAFQLSDGVQAVAAGVLRGLQDTRVPMWLALLGYWVPGLGTAVWLGFYTPLAGTGIWIGLAIGLTVVAVLLTLRFAARGRIGLVPA
ncbi:MATE family efflux transporter [Croceibacterium aestuarii]|uniref:MATE family efflux transporter n=1 Tax=Croceibacterium aestuarii TaxID=3064139 RepID=UPI00272E2E9E|nr:MATE family efflux transporter [Croceibacterium sp. D39]